MSAFVSSSGAPKRKPEAPKQAAERMIRNGQYREALTVLEKGVPTLDILEMRGDAHFLLEEYERAADAYAEATKLAPRDSRLSRKLEHAQTNVLTGVREPVHPPESLTREEALAPPEDPRLPGPFSERRGPGLGQRMGRVLGSVAEASLVFASKFVGPTSGEVWTDWYKSAPAIGILKLVRMRHELNHRNLNTAYPDGERARFLDPSVSAPAGSNWFRTYDGAGYVQNDPAVGMANTRFSRAVDPTVADPAVQPGLMDPPPSEVSRILLTRDEFKPVPFLNMHAASWVQFMIHDWFDHGAGSDGDEINVPLEDDHPIQRDYSVREFTLPKTAQDPSRTDADKGTPPTYQNTQTPWWDGSQIYGKTRQKALQLRSGVDGKLKVDEKALLPLDERGMEMTGFSPNSWLGLNLMHLLFVHEHNAICDMLKRSYPQWKDERLFHQARLINTANIAKIHTVEWTPAILNNPLLKKAMEANWYGLLQNKDKTVSRFSLDSAAMFGIVGNSRDDHGVPYHLPEEFVSDYRMHPLLPESIAIRAIGQSQPLSDVSLAAMRQKGARKMMEEVPVADLFNSFGLSHPGQLVLNNYPNFMQKLTVPGKPAVDLGAIDILRDRERGVPRYNEMRRQLGLKPIRAFEDFFRDKDTDLTAENQEAIAKLKEVYGNDVEKIDFLVGTLAENIRPTGYGFGETQFQIFILIASRRLQADPFFTDLYNAETYTQDGLDWIDNNSMKDIVLRHFPALKESGLKNVDNFFKPWEA